MTRNNSGQRVAQEYRAKVTIIQGSFWNTTNTGVSEACWLVCFSDVRPQHHQHYIFNITWRRNTAQFFSSEPPPPPNKARTRNLKAKAKARAKAKRKTMNQPQRPRPPPPDRTIKTPQHSQHLNNTKHKAEYKPPDSNAEHNHATTRFKSKNQGDGGENCEKPANHERIYWQWEHKRSEECSRKGSGNVFGVRGNKLRADFTAWRRSTLAVHRKNHWHVEQHRRHEN